MFCLLVQVKKHKLFTKKIKKSYLLYWLKQVLQLKYASYSMLFGQIFDAIATPLVGHYSDKTNTKYGKRMPWYIAGFILVFISFFPIFHRFIPGEIYPQMNQNETFMKFYYIFFPSIFNIGWAAVQISHMSLVPSLTTSRKKRDQLNNQRNTFSFVANLTVLGSALIIFQTIPDSKQDFEVLSYIVIILGTVSSIYFIININEKKLSEGCEKETINIKNYIQEMSEKIGENQNKNSLQTTISLIKNQNINHEKFMTWRDWMKNKNFYHYGIVYMGCRLYCNIISTMLNFFMVYVLQIASEQELADKTPIEIALIPLLLYISSVVVSSLLDLIYQAIGKKKAFTFGTFLMLISSLSLSFIQKNTSYLMYPIAIFIGSTQALILNTGITLISDVVGLKGKSGAFVFGSYSFLDKISTGICLFLISESPFFKNADFIRWITVLAPAGSCIFAWILVIYGKAKDYSQKDEQQIIIQNSVLMSNDKYQQVVNEFAG
ncbi:major facilitator superfamily protein, putative [Ichthyophthirius multifiliis]|uniref:Major facilitator superfamily protein, putative n=1 Tax=Ichthyophthirius multifiliis TaxID=5932 RepID=G0QRK6_ICHMU|nr:major facilitator superfamily protein, putative [Ichthyophthirius multifiliis]EGR32150.1 major facilitator superfamily protein, putative [Ichthyophthirius multifiliis]|eukprot:XP_004035636.1 major facilitator superfamily protein, putative [Ichthyophthirius multifiliis]